MRQYTGDIYRPTEKYFMIYWLNGQSHIFSDPQMYATNDKSAFKKALETAKRCEYDVQYHTEI
jgi:hypothetical protein